MATISVTQNLQRHVACPECRVSGESVRDALEAYFAGTPAARGYILDDQGALRKHVVVFVDGRPVRDRQQLSDAVNTESSIYVMQALSGG